MDAINEGTLVRTGLSKNEAKVYLALLKLGKSTVVEITRKSKVHRVNVYDVLERLLEKGLIGTVMQTKKKIYEAANPEHLLYLIKEKEEALDKILPQLKAEFKEKKEKQQVYHFFGIDGIMRAYYMILDQGEMIYGLGASGLNKKYLKHRHIMFTKERLKRKIPTKALYYEFARGSKEKIMPDPTMKLRYLPDKFKTPCGVDICGDLVVNLLPFEDNMMAIVIENRALADSYRQFFNFMWKFANP